MKYVKCIDTGGYTALDHGKIYKVYNNNHHEFIYIHTGNKMDSNVVEDHDDVGGYSRWRFIRADHHVTKLGKILYK